MKKLQVIIVFSVFINVILTFPQFLAFYSMDINTGHYYGLIYPFWLVVVIGLGSGVASNFIVNKYSKKLGL